MFTIQDHDKIELESADLQEPCIVLSRKTTKAKGIIVETLLGDGSF